MRQLSSALVLLSVSVAIVAFFLPWARIELHEPKLVGDLKQTAGGSGLLGGLASALGKVTAEIRRGAETITGELPSLDDIPKQISGVQVPRLVNQEHAKLVMALVELFAGEQQHLGAKSYAVYLVPGIALLMGLLLILLGSRPPVAIALAVLCAGIAGMGFWKLLTTNTTAAVITVTIGEGLWLSLWAYVGLAVAGGLSGLTGRTVRRSTA